MTQTVNGSLSETAPVRRIPPPSGAREPMKVNVFEATATAPCTLIPLFPYQDAGAIVPTVVPIIGDPVEGEWAHFFHYNDVEEVYLTFGASGAILTTGTMLVTQRMHGVHAFLHDSTSADAFHITTVTQHQHESEPQQEAVILRCKECQEELVRFDYDATPKGVAGHDPSQWGGTDDDEVEVFATLWGADKAFAQYTDESVRTCAKCGHVNLEYPKYNWGWYRYMKQIRAANAGKRAIQSAAAEAMQKARGV